MKVGIIGAGFTGLAAALELTKKGHEVLIFEKEQKPGGLAIGFKEEGWKWDLEEHYHHFFTNDSLIFDLAKQVNQKIIIKRPKTSTLIDNLIFQLDSPITLIKFPLLSLFQRTHMGFGLALLRYNPFWKPFDKLNATSILPGLIGKKGYEMIWKPLFKAKFGNFAKDISLAWFWARIRKRTTALAYPEGSFLSFANKLADKIIDNGGKIQYKSEIVSIASDKNVILEIKKGNRLLRMEFDKVIVTSPSHVFLKIAPQLPTEYKSKLENLKSLGATNLFLRFKKPFLKDGTYWLNVCEESSPLMAVVEHTNFIDKSYYNNEHLVYIGHYLPRNHEYFLMSKEDLLKKFDPYLAKLNKDYKKNLIGIEFFKTPFAQPVMPTNYNKIIPPFKTPLEKVYLANIQQVYPWDRGVNYAIELGQKIAKIILNEKN